MKKKIKGLVVPFNTWSNPIAAGSGEFRERFVPGAFKKALANGAKVDLKFEHGFRGKCRMPLASTSGGGLRAWESDRGLEVEGELDDSECSRSVSAAIDRGDLQEMSVGFRGAVDRWNALGTERWIYEAEPFDATVTGSPAYPGTRVEVRSTLPDLFVFLGDDRRAVEDFQDTLRYVRRLPEATPQRSEGEGWLRSRKHDLLRTAELRSRDASTLDEIRSLLSELVPD